MRTILTARISTLIVGLVRGFLSSLRFAESSVCESCGLNISVRAEGGTSGSSLTIDCIPPNALPFSLSAEVTADGRLLILCACSRSENTKSVRGSGVSGGTSYSAESFDKSGIVFPPGYSYKALDDVSCSRCRLVGTANRAVMVHSLHASQNVKPKWPFLCASCSRVIVATNTPT